MGTFDVLRIGTSGLYAAQRGVETAGQNIANVNTKGYARQRVNMTPDSGPIEPAFHSTWTGAGRGVRSTEVERLRDQFIDRRLREEGSLGSELDETQKTLTSIERAFNEPSDTGLSAVMQDFLAAWDDVANQPTDAAARVQLVEQGVTLATNIGQLDMALEKIGDVAASRVDALVAEVNAAAEQVAQIQGTIRSARASGLNVNELLDQRDTLLSDIVDKVGGRARHEDDGTVTLQLGSTVLVRGEEAQAIEVDADGATTTLRFASSGAEIDPAGRIKSLLTTANTTIPDYRDRVDAVAQALHDEVNAQHQAGFDRAGNPGSEFFQIGPDGIEVNAAIRTDSSLVAAAANAGTIDGENAVALAELDGATTLYRESVVNLGVESQTAQRRHELQEAVVTQVEFESEAVHGVNMDEELADLVRFQRSYEANSRFISVVDNLIDVLVNRTGV